MLLINHSAVLTTTKKIAQIKNFFEKTEFADYYAYENVFSEMSYDGDWIEKFRDRDPGLGPAQDAYDYMEEACAGGSYDMWNREKYTLNKLMIRICSNMESHLASHIWKVIILVSISNI